MITGLQEATMVNDEQPTDLCLYGVASRASFENTKSAALPVENKTADMTTIERMDNITTPKLNSHGKITTYKCKQCSFIAATKIDFWQHSKEKHYRPDKTFYCKFCPFATELKHHFEYHMNGHTGTKPYKCDKCDYSCVNKSMLNSHLKSHSQIYQYRCQDCLYVSKYCHSLKNHLRKYNHRPSVVLNLDGTENHHQIIDIYGSRRGPRQKPRAIQNFQPNSPLPETTPPNVPPFPLNPLLNPFMINEMLMQMALQFQQRALLAQNFSSTPSSIHSSENATSEDEEDSNNDSVIHAFRCNICEISFNNKTMHDIHMTDHSSENPLQCQKCKIICENGLDFFKHLHEKH